MTVSYLVVTILLKKSGISKRSITNSSICLKKMTISVKIRRKCRNIIDQHRRVVHQRAYIQKPTSTIAIVPCLEGVRFSTPLFYVKVLSNRLEFGRWDNSVGRTSSSLIKPGTNTATDDFNFIYLFLCQVVSGFMAARMARIITCNCTQSLQSLLEQYTTDLSSDSDLSSSENWKDISSIQWYRAGMEVKRSEAITCKICMHSAKNSCVTLCKHAFCSKCICNWKNQCVSEPTCPVCSQVLKS